MRKVLVAFTALIILSQVFVSCSSDNDVLSQFSKRKYLKKFKSKNVKYDDNIKERENNLTYYQTKHEQEAIVSTQKDMNVVTEIEEDNYSQEVKLKDEVKEEVSRVKKYVDDYKNWSSYNRDFNYFDLVATDTELSNQNNTYHFSNSRASDVVLVILCIFLPPVGVIVYEDTVTGNFWLDLVLTLLFWLPGAVYAFLVCFADVSI